MKCKVDAIIVSDPLVIDMINDNKINLKVHISTQDSVLNYEAVNFFKKLGVERLVLGRETSKDEIKEIIDKTGIEIEMFIHGAMCASLSGRCVLSNYFTGRDANRGGCAQICRWNFDLIKDGKMIDTNTKFTMCSKDLCMLEKIKDIIQIGVTSLKVEGRMRSVYYIATVISTYRKAIDECYQGTLTNEKITYYKKILNRVANRDSCIQFFDKAPGVDEQYFLGRDEISNQDYLGLVSDYDGEFVYMITKNYYEPGYEAEIISPSNETIKLTIPEIYDTSGNRLDAARHPEEIVKFKLDKKVSKMDMMRIMIK